MVDQTFLTIFLAVTAVAVLIQTSILVGFYLLSTKLSRQADHAMDVTRNLLGPLQDAVETLQAAMVRIPDFSSRTQAQLRQLDSWWKRRAA